MTSRAEEIASQCLRSVLLPLAVGAEIEDSDDFREFQSALQFVIADAMLEVYPWWRYESLDGFQFLVARKVGPNEAEFVGFGILITDSALVPLHLRLRVSAGTDCIEWMDCKLGESGSGAGGIDRKRYARGQAHRKLNAVLHRLNSITWAYTVTTGNPGVPFDSPPTRQ